MTELSKLIGSGKLIYGKENTLKKLKEGKIEKVFLSLNAEENVKKDLQRYKDIAGIEIEELNMRSQDLGEFCKKPFAISVLGLVK